MTEDTGVRSAFVAAYPTYVATLLGERGVEVDATIADGIVIGTQVLDGLLTTLESRPPGLQQHSPLELFREALRPVGNALEVVGVEPFPTDENQRELLPWDQYALSPGSAHQIGAEAHEAHLRWGVAKARAHAVRPTAGLRCSDGDAPAFLEQLNAAGYRVIRLPSDEIVSVALVDLGESGVDSIVRATSVGGGRVIVFGDDPDDTQIVRFKALGATNVLTTRALLTDLPAFIPSIA